MLYLITGLPGNGKTLYTIDYVRKFAERENRPVYYHGITDLSESLGWTEFENPEQWHELPEGCIIIIDECQRIFKPLPRSGNVPPHFSELETHRHHGFDLFLITQHPHLIDTRVRRLCGIHRHIIRAFGTHKAIVHEWQEVHSDCEKNRSNSSKTVFPFPKDVFKLYKSAEMHTHKVYLPKVVWYVVICVLLIGFCFWLMANWYRKELRGDAPPESPEQVAASLPAVPDTGGFSSLGQRQPPMSVEEYINSYMPRIDGLPHTAPRYDEITQPKQAPRIVGCVLNKSGCTCYSQQATKINTPKDMCTNIVKNGNMPFYDFLDYGMPDRRVPERAAFYSRDSSLSPVSPPQPVPVL